jgi:hypothetical protein
MLQIFLMFQYNFSLLLKQSVFLIRTVGGVVQIGSTRHVGHFWPIVPDPCECDDGEFGGMKTGRGNRSTRRKPAPAPHWPPQIQTDETRTAAVGSQRLTAWAIVRIWSQIACTRISIIRIQVG